jgi:hypothetical protein
MKKGCLFLFLLLLNFSFVSSAIMHPASSINITVDNSPRTLDSGASYFIGTSHSYTSLPSLLLPPGQHNASQIWVSVYSGEMTLFQALQENKLCPKSTKPLNYTSTIIPNPSHLATEVNVTFLGKNFQKAINDGDFSGTSSQCYDNDVYSYDSCGNSLGKTQECGDSYCGAWGAEYCNSNQHAVQDRTCHTLGCSNGACYDTPYAETKDNGEAPIYWCIENEPDDGGGKVICTELYTTGVLDGETYKMDVKYASEHFSKEALRGYQAWAIPVVYAMRKSPEEAKRIVIPLVNSFMEEIAYRSGKRETGNEVGKLFLDEGVPLFERIGKYIDEPDWKSLFNQNWLNVILKRDNFLLSYMFNYKSFLQKENKYDEIVKDYFTEEKVREMFYDAERRGGDSQLAIAKALIENLEGAVEDIESLIKSA